MLRDIRIACTAVGLTLAVPCTVFADQPGSAPAVMEPAAPNAAASGEVASGLEVKQQNGISYVSGGVGDEQQDALERMGSFNFKLTLAAADGKYMGPTALRIEKGGAAVLETTSEGPLFLAKMPPGQYTLRASGEGQTFSRQFTIGNTGQQQMVLTWPMHEHGSRAGDAPE